MIENNGKANARIIDRIYCFSNSHLKKIDNSNHEIIEGHEVIQIILLN